MPINTIPEDIRARFRFREWNHAVAILSQDFPGEFQDIMDCLRRFTLRRSDILLPGGRKSVIADRIDNHFRGRGWSERGFDIQILVDGEAIPTPTHKIDNFKNRVGVEVEWNNKTEFCDRDLNNFRLLRELRVLSVGVIITRVSELQEEFKRLDVPNKYGASTTHWDKLIPKIDGGGPGGCPLLVVGIGLDCYDANG